MLPDSFPKSQCLILDSSLISPPPLSRLFITYNGIKTHHNDSGFSCSVQKPMLMFPLWRDETPASFTPDVMQSEIRSPIALGHRYKRKYLFLTSSLLHYGASVAGSTYSAHQQTSTEIKSPFFFIVHHNECFHHCSLK